METKNTSDLIKTLRETTGCGLLDCKNALEYAKGDVILAYAYLHTKSFGIYRNESEFEKLVQHNHETIQKGK